MKLKRVLWMTLGVFAISAMLYFVLLEMLWNHLQTRRLVKKLAKSSKPKDQLIRLLVYKIFGM